MSATPAPVPVPSLPEIPDAPVAVSPRAAAPNLLFTPSKLRVWGARSAYSLADQGLTALTGFCVNFLLARWMLPETYGAYAIAFAAYLFMSGLHNVIVLEPMSVLGPSRYATKMSDYFRAQILVHVALLGVLATLAVTVGLIVWRVAPTSPLIGAVIGAGLASPFLLLLCLARRVCYIQQRPITAVFGSASCLFFALPGLYAVRYLGLLTPLSAFLLIAIGSLIGSYLVLRRVGLYASKQISHARIRWMSTLGENWRYGYCLVGGTICYSVAGQLQMFLTAAFLGLGAAGVLRAMLLPASVMTQVVTAAGLLVLPGFSYDFGKGLIDQMRQKAVLVSFVLGSSGLCYALLLALTAGRAEHLLFSGKFAEYAWLMPILALVPAANGVTMGYSAALRASQKPHFDLLANLIATPVATISAFPLIRWWGLAGAATSMVAGLTVYMGANCWLFYTSPKLSPKTTANRGAISDGQPI
jgi:O-antigen/teichoic acid export membrane protein